MAEWFFAAAIAVLLFPWARGRYQSWKYNQHPLFTVYLEQEIHEFGMHAGREPTKSETAQLAHIAYQKCS